MPIRFTLRPVLAATAVLLSLAGAAFAADIKPRLDLLDATLNAGQNLSDEQLADAIFGGFLSMGQTTDGACHVTEQMVDGPESEGNVAKAMLAAFKVEAPAELAPEMVALFQSEARLKEATAALRKLATGEGDDEILLARIDSIERKGIALLGRLSTQSEGMMAAGRMTVSADGKTLVFNEPCRGA